MAEHHVKLEITPRVVDLGDRVIQLHHVVSVGRHTVHPFRPIGVVVMAVGAVLIGSEVVLRGAAAFALEAGGSLPLWFGFAALGIGLFLLLYVRRVLSIQTSDGRRVELSAASEEAAGDLILRIRGAMEAAGGMHGTYKPGYPASALQAGGEPASLPSQTMPPSAQSLPEAAGSGLPPFAAQGTGEPAGARTIPAGRHGGGYPNGHAVGSAFGGTPSPGAGSITDQAVQAYRRAGSGTAPPQQREHGGLERRLTGPEAASTPTARDSLALPATLPSGFARDDGAQELHALMEHVRRSDVQHKEALLDLLRVVEEHYRGRASREDAIAHWRSFADYVVQYLGNVDGLIAHTERFGRHMLGR